MLWLIGLVCLLLWAILHVRKKYQYFKQRGINTAGYWAPFFDTVLGKEHFTGILKNIYKEFPNDRFTGIYEGLNPIVRIRDPELIRSIGIKNFDHFVNHRTTVTESDPYFSQSLIALKDQKWRDMRSTLSPAFTGSKLKNMVLLIEECSKNIYEHIKSEIEKNPEGFANIDSMDLMKRCTNDIIATTAFGLRVDSVKEQDNIFFKMGYKLTKFSVGQAIKVAIALNIPLIGRILTKNIFSTEAINFFKNVVLDTMKDRKENNKHRSDLIQLLVEAREGSLVHENAKEDKTAGFATVEESDVGKSAIKNSWNDKELVSQALLFFFAGFDTVSTGLRFLLFELATNTDVQNKLQQEVDDYYDKTNGKIDFNSIASLKYLDMVVSEVLRKWPPAAETDRVCARPFNIGRPNDTAKSDYIVEKGRQVSLPIYALHHDPQYYPDPDKFDPERFSDENKHNIKPFTYLPFGIGPRNCIGSRFALMEIKIFTLGLMRHFDIFPSPSTILPGRYEKRSIALTLEGGHTLKFQLRKHKIN